jgi:hypothetical protein
MKLHTLLEDDDKLLDVIHHINNCMLSFEIGG